MKIITSSVNGKTRVSMTKQDWIRIGLKNCWMKQSQTDSITIDRNRFTTNKNYPSITFTIGKKYFDAAGNYIVTGIDNDKIEYEYLDGVNQGKKNKVLAYTKAYQMYTINLKRDQQNNLQPINFTGDRESWVLGYLSSYGKIIAQVPSDERKSFEDLYQRMAKESALKYIESAIYRIEKPESKYHLSLRIKFPTPPEQYIGFFKSLGSEVRINNATEGMEINNNNFIKNLFAMGFKLGGNKQNIEAIKNGLPQESQQSFVQGTTVREQN